MAPNDGDNRPVKKHLPTGKQTFNISGALQVWRGCFDWERLPHYTTPLDY